MNAEEIASIDKIRQADSLNPIIKLSRISEIKQTFSSSRQSSLNTIFNIVNSTIGHGTLFMPLEFLKTGLITDILIVILVSVIEYSTGIRYFGNYLQTEGSNVPQQVERILGRKWKKIYILSAVIELITVMFAYFLLMSNIIHTLLQPFLNLPDKNKITFGLFSFQWIGVILAIVCFGLCSIKEIKFNLLFNVLGVHIIRAYMLFLFCIGFKVIISLKVNFDVAQGGILLFSGQILTILGVYAFAYYLHPYLIEIFKHNSWQHRNVRDFGLSYVLGTVIYVGVIIFAAFGVFWRPGCSKNSKTVLDCFKDNHGAIKYFAAGTELLLFLQILTVVPIFCFVTRSQLFSLFYHEHEKVAPWKIVMFNVIFGIGGLAIQIPNLQTSMAMCFCGAICAFVFLYLIPIKMHLKIGGKPMRMEEDNPLETQINSDATRRKAAKREAEQRVVERREAEKREIERKEAERRRAERREAEKKEAERKECERREDERREIERKEAERRQAERRQAERRSIAERIKYNIQKTEEAEKEEEMKEQTNHLIRWDPDSKRTTDLKQIIEEKSCLIILSTSTEDQFKTLCFQPTSNQINRMNGIETSCFKSTPIQEDDSQPPRKFVETRTRFENTDSFPYSVHGIVRADLGNGNYKTGTGILIGVDLVLTAAHNICDVRKPKAKYSEIEFIPGINEQEAPFRILKVRESYVPDEFTKTCEKEDYALLVLKGTPGVRTGYFGLHVANKEFLKGRELNVVGYPGHVRTKDERNKLKILSGEGRHQLWGMKGNSDFWAFGEEGKNDENLINYSDILTTPGQSGSGVFYQVEGKNEYYVIGVHILGRDGEGSYSSATWISKERLKNITMWIGESRKNLIDRKIKRESQSGAVKIKALNFEENDIGDFGGGALLTYHITSLEILNLKRNRISSTGFKLLSERTSWPNLKILELSGNYIRDEGAKVLSDNKSWTNIETLDLSDNAIGNEGAKALSDNKSWTNIKTLDLSDNAIGNEGAKVLSDNKSWTNLATLYLSRNNISDEGVKALSDSKSWMNLATLDLSKNHIRAQGAKGLSDNKSWTNITTLNLSSNIISAGGAKALSDNKSWINLTKLDLSHNYIAAAGSRALGNNSSWTNITTLYLSRNNIGDKGVKALSDSKSWMNLATLELSWNDIGDEGAKALSDNKLWTNLTTLILLSNEIGDEGAKGLSDNKSWMNLTTLDLNWNNIGAEGAKALSDSKSWMNLATLELSQNMIDDEGAKGLSENKLWKNLATLNLSLNMIGDEGAVALSNNKSWSKLTTLDLSENKIGAEGAIALIERWPDLKLKK